MKNAARKPAAIFLAPLLVAAFSLGALAGPPLEEAKKQATKEDYTLDTSRSSAEIKVNENGTFSLIIKAKPGLKIHPDAPLEVKFKPAKGLAPAKAKLTRKDVVDEKSKTPELKVALKATEAGKRELEAKVSFFLCTDEWCQRMKDTVQVAVNVNE
jgi:hypothetical protein